MVMSPHKGSLGNITLNHPNKGHGKRVNNIEVVKFPDLGKVTSFPTKTARFGVDDFPNFPFWYVIVSWRCNAPLMF